MRRRQGREQMLTWLSLFGHRQALANFSVLSDGGVFVRRQQYIYRLALPPARLHPTSRSLTFFLGLAPHHHPRLLSSPYPSISSGIPSSAFHCRIPAGEIPLLPYPLTIQFLADRASHKSWALSLPDRNKITQKTKDPFCDRPCRSLQKESNQGQRKTH